MRSAYYILSHMNLRQLHSSRPLPLQSITSVHVQSLWSTTLCLCMMLMYVQGIKNQSALLLFADEGETSSQLQTYVALLSH